MATTMSTSVNRCGNANVIKGAKYEAQVLQHLRDKGEEAWLWQNVPEHILEAAGLITDYARLRMQRKKMCEEGLNPLMDTGTDVVSKLDGQFFLNQAKNYSGTVRQGDLAGIFRMLYYHDLPGRIFYANQVSKVVTDVPSGFDKISFVRLPYVDATADSPAVPQLVLRNYQQEAVAACSEALRTENRATLEASCGSGKTLISATVALEYKRVVVFGPLKTHAEQNLERFSDVLTSHKKLLVDSDGCRDLDQLKLFVKDKCLLAATFKSADVIQELLEDDCEDTLVVIDEVHNVSRTNLLDADDPLNNLLESRVAILSVSATPRSFAVENDDEGEDRNERYLGKKAFSLSLGEAIQRGIVCDYRVFLPLLQEVGQEAEVRLEAGLMEADQELLMKACFILKGLLQEGGRKCIAYLQTHAQVNEFAHILQKVAQEYFGLVNAFLVSSILSTDSKCSRKDKLKAFEGHSGIACLLSVDILSEGIDIPACDSVFFAYPCRDKVCCVQRTCRANRLDPNNPGKVALVFVWSSAENDSVEFISALKEVDTEFCKKISVVSREYNKTSAVKKQELVEATAAMKEWCVGVKEYVRKGTIRASVMAKACAYADFFKKTGRHPLQTKENLAERDLAIWIIFHREKGTPEVRLYLDEHAPGWNEYTNDKLLLKAKRVVMWVAEHTLLPYQSGNDEEQALYFFLEAARQTKRRNGRNAHIQYLDEHLPLWDNPRLYTKILVAKEVVAWVKANGGNLPTQSTDGKKASFLASKKTFPPEVVELLNQELPNWDYPLWYDTLRRLQQVVDFVDVEKRLPLITSKEEAEHFLGAFLFHLRVKKDTIPEHHRKAKQYLDERIAHWDRPLVYYQVQRAREFIDFVRQKKRYPRSLLEDCERSLYKWFSSKRSVQHPEVQAVLDNDIPGWRTRTLPHIP